MMTTRKQLIDRTETADEYGRRENCLKNHRRAPFCFQSHIPYLKSTAQKTERDRLVAQSGLQAIALPQARIIDDAFDFGQITEVALQRLLEGSSLQTPPLISRPSLKDLLVPVESLDLGSRPEIDVQEYLSQISAKQYSNPFNQWLPLSSVRVDRDEGLPFPPKTDRLQSLLQRELERETITVSDDASIFEQDAYRPPLTAENKQFLANYAKPEASPYYYYPEPITPPLSPVSDDPLPFVPNDDSTIIDLTSEPSSPTNREVQFLQEGCLDSEPVMPSTLPTSSPSQGLPEGTKGLGASLEDIMVEVPVVFTSSDTACDENILANFGLPCIANDEDIFGPQHDEGAYFEDTFMALLNSRRSYADQLTEQERLNPTDSISRVHVPILNFKIPQPEWSNDCSSAKAHFAWLKDTLQGTFNIPVMPRDARSDSTLKWTPAPPRSGRVLINEELQLLSQSSRSYLALERTPTLSSASFVSITASMAILQLPQDDEIEGLEPLTDDCINQAPSLTTTEKHHGVPNHQGSTSEVESTYFQKQESPSLLRPLRRKTIDDSVSVLPKPSDTSATSKLLSVFMELRAAKKPRLDISSTPIPQTVTTSILAPRLQDNTPQVPKGQARSHENDQEMVSATGPEMEIASEKGAFIVSLGLGRSILRHLEILWPPENLIDIDYSRHNTMAWPPSTAQPKETASPLTFEADISLSPAAGVIVTNLLKVKQRPLPGSKTQTQLRERVQKVSQKYETLTVLVSESNPAGEFTRTQTPSDVAAYADFVRFAVALEAGVNVFFVQGAEGTLAKWILCLMCRYSHQSLGLKPLLSAEETTWEVFLRQAGMNVVAAKVLSKMLFEQAGASGLAKFLTMSTQERISRYAQLLQGEKVLRMSGQLLDRKWG